MTETVEVVVVGAGQAGLSLSHELCHAGIDHVVLERGLVGETWRGRWDSFCLVIPNWTVQLPGSPYRGGDPDGFILIALWSSRGRSRRAGVAMTARSCGSATTGRMLTR